jgi:hypothetical protein
MAQTKFNARLGLSVGANATDVLDSSGSLLITVPATAGGTGLTGPGTLGNVLTSTGTSWVSQAPASSASGYTKAESDALYATITTVNAIPNPVAMALVFGS